MNQMIQIPATSREMVQFISSNFEIQNVSVPHPMYDLCV
jgi:hypothetical protein